MTNNHKRKCSRLLVSKETRIKTSPRSLLRALLWWCCNRMLDTTQGGKKKDLLGLRVSEGLVHSNLALGFRTHYETKWWGGEAKGLHLAVDRKWTKKQLIEGVVSKCSFRFTAQDLSPPTSQRVPQPPKQLFRFWMYQQWAKLFYQIRTLPGKVITPGCDHILHKPSGCFSN